MVRLGSWSRRQFLSRGAGAVGAGVLLATGYGQALLPRQWTGHWIRLEAFGGQQPLPRLHASMVYDSGQDRMLVFGGSMQGGFANDVWAYSFAEQRWSELSAQGASPRPQRLAALRYDDSAHQLVLHSGAMAQRFDLATKSWSKQLPLAVAPQNVWLMQAGATFGVSGMGAETVDRLFKFDGSTRTWRTRQQSEQIAARNGATLAYAPEHEATFLYGGNQAQPKVWAHVKDQWVSLAQHHELTPSRQRHAAAWVPGRGMVVFGGLTDTVKNDLWLFAVT